MITVGKKAPPFTLFDQDDNRVRLADYKGQWVVLYFYPRDDTPGCTKEACEFTAKIRDFDTVDAVVLGCSPDTPECHRAFVKKDSLKVTLLSDQKHVVMEKCVAWGEKVLYGRTTIGVKRSTVIIDPSGMVAHRWRAAKAAGHADKAQERVAELAGRAAADLPVACCHLVVVCPWMTAGLW